MNKISKTTIARMVENWKDLSENEVANLLVMVSLIIGAGFRLAFPLLADFPIGDGGLFYKIVQAVQENQYRIPAYVNYNGLTIPFAYPPLAFYLVGFIADLFHVPLIDVMRWFPAVVLVLSLPVFYFLAKSLMGSPLKASLALMILALFPRSVTWLIKGGGITRSLGQLFFMAAAVSFYLLFKSKNKKYLIPAILLSALVCLTHPEAAIHTVGAGFLMWLFYGRNREGIFHSIIIGIGTLVLTALWWLPILIRHGLSPFLQAAQTGWNEITFVLNAFFVPFTHEQLMTVISVLMILGFAVQLVKREFLLPFFFILPFIVEPRNAPNIAVVPAAMLAAIAISDLIFPTLANISRGVNSTDKQKLLRSGAEWAILLYLIFSLLIGTQIFIPSLLAGRTTAQHRNAMEWSKKNTPASSAFLIITHEIFPLNDPINEWFPVIADRKSLTTIQGYEWLEDEDFNERLKLLESIQQCIDVECLENKAQKAGISFSYLYIASPESRLGFELRNSSTYILVFENENALVFKKRE